MKVKLDIKPLSVNEAWQGRRFKTDEYKRYERNILLMLPILSVPTPPYRLSFTFGFSNSLSDIDNPVKLITDILQKKYKINDKDIYQLSVQKTIVKKGKEFIELEIKSINK